MRLDTLGWAIFGLSGAWFFVCVNVAVYYTIEGPTWAAILWWAFAVVTGSSAARVIRAGRRQ